MRNKIQEKFLRITLVIITFVMIVLRFLLNEKGRVTPDSIRFMRFSHNLPIIDNTTTPLGYPLSIKIFTLLGLDDFWSSKLVGILAYLFLIFFAWKMKFYLREIILTSGLFSFVSLFAATLSESLFLAFTFIFIYISQNIIIDKWKFWTSIVYCSSILILLFNIRYNALFFMGSCLLYGLYKFKYQFGKIFITSSLLGFLFIILYKLIFIDYYNPEYIKGALDLTINPTSKLLKEFLQGLATSFNPFIHIANPSKSILNLGIYGIGFLNIIFTIFMFLKIRFSETEKFIVFTGFIGIICSFLIQYFYQTDALDYRLLSGFSFLIWLIYFRKSLQIFARKIYILTIISLASGIVFIWFSKGNYIENRKIVKTFLLNEDLLNKKIIYFKNDKTDTRYAEIISTVNPNLTFTKKSIDTLNKRVITNFEVEKKMKINKNKYR